MGRMKELFVELQDTYGENLENLPSDFSYDDYMKDKADESC